MNPAEEIILALRLFTRRWKKADADNRRSRAKKTQSQRQWVSKNREHYNDYQRRYKRLLRVRRRTEHAR